MVRRHGGAAYVFTVAMRGAGTRATFTLPQNERSSSAEVLGEARSIAIQNGKFEDEFSPYEVHLYRIK